MEIPVKPARMIHFLDASNEKMVAKVPDMVKATDVLLGNLEDAIPADRKEAARDGLVKVAKETDLGDTALWTRVNSLESPWVLDDFLTLVPEIGDKLEVIMVPKVEGAWDIHYVDRLLAQLEAKAGARAADPRPRDPRDRARRLQPRGDRDREPADAGDELRPGRPRRLAADEDDPRRRRPPRLPHDRGPRPRRPRGAPRHSYMQDPWHYSIARMVDACNSAGILPFYGPYGDIKDVKGCETQFRAAFLLGCVGAWSLHPVQIDIAKKVFSPDPEEVKFAKKVLEAIPDGRGVHMIDGKMQDDATWKQCKVMVSLAEHARRAGPGAGRGLRALSGAAEPAASDTDAGPLLRVRPAEGRLQRPLPVLFRHRHHRALA